MQNLADQNREPLARRATETLALVAAAAALKASAPPEIAEAFARNRLGGIAGRIYGDPLPAPLVETLLQRSLSSAA